MLDGKVLEQQAAAAMEAHRVPGLALAVIYRGEVIYEGGFGVTSVADGGLPVTPRTVFRVGSVSKPLSGTVIMRMVEEGRLDLDRPVTDYLPWLRLSEEGAAGRVTLRMLLSHTSGMGSVANAYGPREEGALEQMARELLPKLPMEAPPGKVYAYSNPGLSLAALVAAYVAGKPFGQLARELLFDPLGMERTTFDPLVAMTYPLALPHVVGPDGQLRVDRPFADNAHFHPAGFTMTTVRDLARFAHLHMNGGDGLLRPETVELMHTVQAPHFRPDGGGYGLTFFAEAYKGQKLVRHGGGIHTYHASLDMLPASQTAFLFMANRPFPPGVMAGLINQTFDQLLDLPAALPGAPAVREVDVDSSRWPSYTGTYVCHRTGLVRVAEQDGRLALERNGQQELLTAHPNGCFTTPAGAPLGFVDEPDGPSLFMMLDGRLHKRIVLDPAYTLPAAVLEAAPGTYHGPTGGKEAVIRVEQGRILVAFGWNGWREVPATPLNSPTQFVSPVGTFTLGDGALTMNGWEFRRNP